MTSPSPVDVSSLERVEQFRANVLLSSNIRGGSLNHLADHEWRALYRAAIASHNTEADALREALRDLAEAARNSCSAVTHPPLTEALANADELLLKQELK